MLCYENPHHNKDHEYQEYNRCPDTPVSCRIIMMVRVRHLYRFSAHHRFST
jgi:hypothetical protein